MRVVRHPFVLLSLVASAVAQPPAMKDVHRVFPAFRYYGDVHAVGDVTGDGIADIVFIVRANPGVVWRASPDGVYTIDQTALPQHDEFCRAVLLADVDGDGDLDCVTADALGNSSSSPGYAGYDRVYLNDGAGRFTESPASPLAGSNGTSTCVAAADIDGDGDQDLAFGRGPATIPPWPFPLGGENLVYVNDGSGGFTLDTSRLPGTDYTNAIAFLDYDGDGDQDLYIGNDSAGQFDSAKLYANDGLGYFSQVALAAVPSWHSTQQVHARDFDADGDPDLLTLETTQVPSQQVLRYLENDGNGGLIASPTAPPLIGAAIDQLLLGDWNADGRTDYALRNAATLHAFSMVAPGLFQPGPLPVVATGKRMTVALDYDGDGDSDLIAPSAYVLNQYGSPIGSIDTWLLRNAGMAWVTLPPTSLPPVAYGIYSVQNLADIDGDGHLDIVRGPWETQGGRVLLGSGTGTFTEIATGDFGLHNARTYDVAVGDVDGDGDADIVCANRNEPYYTNPLSALFLNQNGTFQSAPFPALYAENVALADLDGDGDLDAVLATPGYPAWQHVLVNDGSGGFQPVPNALPPIDALSDPLQLADFDGDGHVDIAVYYASGGADTGILVNSGNATFTTLSVPGLNLNGPIAADFDADGDVDLLVEGIAAGAPHKLYSNNGTATFTVRTIPSTGTAAVRRLIAADLDVDGLLDVVEATCGMLCDGAPPRILRNTGGAFAPVPNGELDWPYDILHAASVGDLDEDGDPDLLLTHSHGTFLYRSLWHQLAWRSLPRVGHPLVLDLFGRANEPYVLAFTLWPANLPIPGLGTLHLDPATLQILLFAGYDQDGHAEFTAPVPNNPGLLGLSIYWQALSFSPPRLGNLEVTTLQAH